MAHQSLLFYVSHLFCVIFTVHFFPIMDHESEINKKRNFILHFCIYPPNTRKNFADAINKAIVKQVF